MSITTVRRPPTPAAAGRLDILVGAGAALLTVAIWSLWLVGTRAAMGERLPLPILGLCRYGIPALVLAPLWWRHGMFPRGVPLPVLAFMVAGAGAPFLLLIATAAKTTPVSHLGVLLPGAMPLFVALLSRLFDGERFTGIRIAGFALVIAGVVAIGGFPVGVGGVGESFIVAGALSWAAYTIAYRRSGLPPFVAAGIIGAWSTLLLMPFALMTGAETLAAIPARLIMTQAVLQGGMSGVIALASYGLAVSRLGASRAAAMTALVPAAALLFAIPLLGETPQLPALVGSGLVGLGVIFASGAVRRLRQPAA